MIHLIEFFKNKPDIGRYLLYGVIFAIFVWSMTIDKAHAHTWMEKYIPGFWSIFGFLSAVVLISVARWFASAGIEKEEDYYDN